MKSLAFRLWVVGLILALGLFFIAPAANTVQSQGPAAVQTLESDDPRIFQNGTWSTQNANAASNGNYLFSSGAEADALGLSFVGSAIEIIYVSGPQFGTLAIEIDGTVVRTVITTHEKIEYAQSTRVDYLSDEPHSLKVYAQAGSTIAIDAFRISPIVGDGPVPSQNTNDGGIQSSVCAPVNTTHRVSLTATGQQAPSGGIHPDISNNGRYVGFQTVDVLVNGDNNGVTDAYLFDRQTCAVELISVNSTGAEGNSSSERVSLSADADFIAFHSSATNLVTGDTNGQSDIFLRSRITNTTIRVSVTVAGAEATGGSSFPDISSNGRYITFESSASNLVAGDSNGFYDIFVRDRIAPTTVRVSIASGGTQGNDDSTDAVISDDGRFVAFTSEATNLVAGDTNGVDDIFVHDRQTNSTARVSVATGGAQGNGRSYLPSISSNGRYVAFSSQASNLVSGDSNSITDVFVHDRQTGQTSRVSVVSSGAQSNGASDAPDFSGDGRYVTFQSDAANLVPGDTNAESDIFVHDRTTGTTTRLSVNTGGNPPSDGSYLPAISNDGRYVTFLSPASDLVAGDTNGQNDIFVTSRTQPSSDNLALFQPTHQGILLVDTLVDNPPPANFTFFSSYAPVAGGQWIMGDWDADGLKTPGVYLNGAFHYTNDAHETKTWYSIWLGINGPVVAGAFEVNHDCVGAIDSANFPPFGTAFVFYVACDLTPNTAPPLSSQWLSVLLPDSGGFSGTHQFVMGDWNGDGVETIAVRRGAYITWTNDHPFNGSGGFADAQYFGAPGAGSEGQLVDGDWDRNGIDSFGLFYQNGELFYRNDLTFNSGVYVNQSVGTPFGPIGVQATTWH